MARLALLALAALAVAPVHAGDILATEGYQSCHANATVTVDAMNISFDRRTNVVSFNVAGTSVREQNVTAGLVVLAYGIEVYNRTFNPCDNDTYVEQLCPVPAGTFAANGSQRVPDEYVHLIPGIAYTLPDLGGEGRLQLFDAATNATIACVESSVGNGRTFKVPAVQYVSVGMAGAALAVSGLTAFGALGAAGGGAGGGGAMPSPTFVETLGWFQGLAMNGMLSVAYPPMYRSFVQNFGFSTGLVSWPAMQTALDGFRAKTGGNLTEDSRAFLENATLVYGAGSARDIPGPVNSVSTRALSLAARLARLGRREDLGIDGLDVSINGTAPAPNATTAAPDLRQVTTVSGMQAYAEQLMIPRSNTFLTVLLVFAIAIAAIVAGILLFKAVLETWALLGRFPRRLEGFRRRYWWSMAKTITTLILALYGVWVMYCIYQFRIGDSWAARVLAGVTLGLFTAILVGFTVKIIVTARRGKAAAEAAGNGAGAATLLYEDKETWIKYSIFYDSYKKHFWWFFVPVIVYMAAKGAIIAGGQGHGLVQCAGQLALDVILLVLLLFAQPYSLKSGLWINIVIQVVRVLSVACILVFVEELGVSQTTQTVAGLALIIVQGVLTALLAILIAVNALVGCIRINPHRRARKEAEKARRGDDDNLTDLAAHNSWLLGPVSMAAMDKLRSRESIVPLYGRGRALSDYETGSSRAGTPVGGEKAFFAPDNDRIPLTAAAANMGAAPAQGLASNGAGPWSYMGRQPMLPVLADLDPQHLPGKAL